MGRDGEVDHVGTTAMVVPAITATTTDRLRDLRDRRRRTAPAGTRAQWATGARGCGRSLGFVRVSATPGRSLVSNHRLAHARADRTSTVTTIESTSQTTISSAPQFPTAGAGMGFNEASAAVVDYLKSVLPMGFWAVTRFDGERQLYLEVRDDSYGLGPGGSHLWDDSFCINMVAGKTPRIAPDAMAVPEYATAGVAKQIDIGAYVGIPTPAPVVSCSGPCVVSTRRRSPTRCWRRRRCWRFSGCCCQRFWMRISNGPARRVCWSEPRWLLSPTS